jgi:hypothetical protein
MGWLGGWIGAWAGRWLGFEPEEQATTVPYTRFGRILSPSTDRLFGVQVGSSPLCEISSSAVCLGRTDTDDYVRFRVPDTNCPPLPEPNHPLDSGFADLAEPARWVYGGTYQLGTGWRFGATAGQALDWVQPSYTCYDGDFETQVTLSWSDAGLPRTPNAQSADFDLFVFGLPAQNSGIALGWFGGESANQPWDLGVYAYVNGSVGTQLGWLRAGTTGVFKLRRVGSTVSVQYGSSSATVATGVSGQVQLRLWRDFSGEPPFVHIPGVTVTKWETLSGAPDFIWVQTPVVDLGQPLKREVRGLPRGIQLTWRASNTPFNAGDTSPSWTNPTGEYRYWQARATTTSISTLIERIEFGKYPVLESVWLRNRFIWLVRTDKNPVVVPFRPVAWSHRVRTITQTAGGYEVTFYDAADEYSLLLEER